jgi:hypothetical protein
MHIVVSWDISAPKPRWDEIDAALRRAMTGYSWARPLSTFYVVRINSETDRVAIREGMLSVARGVSERVHFAISPAMSGGRYDGYLPNDMWAQLNERSDP